MIKVIREIRDKDVVACAFSESTSDVLLVDVSKSDAVMVIAPVVAVCDYFKAGNGGVPTREITVIYEASKPPSGKIMDEIKRLIDSEVGTKDKTYIRNTKTISAEPARPLLFDTRARIVDVGIVAGP